MPPVTLAGNLTIIHDLPLFFTPYTCWETSLIDFYPHLCINFVCPPQFLFYCFTSATLLKRCHEWLSIWSLFSRPFLWAASRVIPPFYYSWRDKSNHSQHVLSVLSVPGTGLSRLHALSHMTLTTNKVMVFLPILQMRSRRLREVNEVRANKIREGIQTQAVWLQNSSAWQSCNITTVPVICLKCKSSYRIASIKSPIPITGLQAL